MQSCVTLEDLRLLVAGGSLKAATALGDGDGWLLRVALACGENAYCQPE